MRNLRAYIYSIIVIFLLIGISNASNLENRVTSYFNGLMAELVDAEDLKSFGIYSRPGSSPGEATK